MIADHRRGIKPICVLCYKYNSYCFFVCFIQFYFLSYPQMMYQPDWDYKRALSRSQVSASRKWKWEDGCVLFIGWLVCLLLAELQPVIVEGPRIKVVKAGNKMFGWWWHGHVEVLA